MVDKNKLQEVLVAYQLRITSAFIVSLITIIPISKNVVVQFLFCFLKVLTYFYVVRQKSLLTHFMPLISFSLKSSKNQRFFDVSRGYRKRALIRIASKRNLEIRKLNQNFVLNLVFLFISFWDIFLDLLNV